MPLTLRQVAAKKAFLLLLFPLTLAGCGETEEQCFKRLTKNLSSSQILAEVGIRLGLIYVNNDLNVCDYTVLGNDIIKK